MVFVPCFRTIPGDYPETMDCMLPAWGGESICMQWAVVLFCIVCILLFPGYLLSIFMYPFFSMSILFFQSVDFRVFAAHFCQDPTQPQPSFHFLFAAGIDGDGFSVIRYGFQTAWSGLYKLTDIDTAGFTIQKYPVSPSRIGRLLRRRMSPAL